MTTREDIAAAFGFELSELGPGQEYEEKRTREKLYKEWLDEAAPKLAAELSELLPDGLEFVWGANDMVDLTGLTCESRTSAWVKKE